MLHPRLVAIWAGSCHLCYLEETAFSFAKLGAKHWENVNSKGISLMVFTEWFGLLLKSSIFLTCIIWCSAFSHNIVIIQMTRLLQIGLKMGTTDKVVYDAPMWHWREESKSTKLSKRQLWDRKNVNPLLLLGSSYFAVAWLTQLTAHHWELIAQPRAYTIKQAFPDGLSIV